MPHLWLHLEAVSGDIWTLIRDSNGCGAIEDRGRFLDNKGIQLGLDHKGRGVPKDVGEVENGGETHA